MTRFLTVALAALTLAACDSASSDPTPTPTPTPAGPYAGVLTGSVGGATAASPWTEGFFSATAFNIAGVLPIAGSMDQYEVVISTDAAAPGTYAPGVQNTRIETRRYRGAGDNHTRVVATTGQLVITAVEAGVGARGTFAFTATDGATYSVANGVFNIKQGYTQN